MNYMFDWILIILSTAITLCAYKKIVLGMECSVSYYVILIIYIFCCLPILLNYLIGMPQYQILYWYRVFSAPMYDAKIAVIYDAYILTSIIVLWGYAKKCNKRNIEQINREQVQFSKEADTKFLHFIVIFSPMIYIIFSGNYIRLFNYTSMAVRGFSREDSLILNGLILLSIYNLCIYVFSGKITRNKIFFLIVVSVLLAWMQGKRFIVAVMAILYLFFLTKSNISHKTRKRLLWVLPICGVGLILFSIVYYVMLKQLSVTRYVEIYEMLRVDFGRDDVIKYVIQKEFFQRSHILDYPGQSFFSTLLVFIPRFIWHSKPYSHYQYLTSSILGVAIERIPAGTTPCWYEMCLCNFGLWGFALGIAGLPLLCRFADNMKQVKSKSLVFMLVLVLLTQNTDVYIVYIFLIIIYYIFENIKHKKIVLVSGIKKVTWKHR